MFIKIEVEGQEDIFYSLSKAEIYIGSAARNNITIKDTSTSKRHLKILLEEGKWFAVDLGSTNGSFMEEEDQLIPGKKVEFSEESILRLGNHVVITLVRKATNALQIQDYTPPPVVNEENSDQHDKTQLISLAEFQKARLIAAAKKKKEQKKKKILRDKRKRAERIKILKVGLLIIGFLFIANYGNKLWRERLKEINRDTIMKKVQTEMNSGDEVEMDVKGFRISRGSLLSRNKIISLIQSPKCKDDLTSPLCTHSRFHHKDNGITRTGNSYIFFLEENSLLEEYKFVLPPLNKENGRQVQKLAILRLLREQFPDSPLPIDSEFYFALYHYDEDQYPQLSAVGAMNSSSGSMILDEMKTLNMAENSVELSKKLPVLDTYFTVY